MRNILWVVYLVIGVIVASNQGYLGDVNGFGDILNLLLAILLWPLLLFGVDFNIRLGGGGRNGRDSFVLFAPAARIGGSNIVRAVSNSRRHVKGG